MVKAVTHWEYLAIPLRLEARGAHGGVPIVDTARGSTAQLDALGQEGWELVNVIPTAGGALAFFKRPLPAEQWEESGSYRTQEMPGEIR